MSSDEISGGLEGERTQAEPPPSSAGGPLPLHIKLGPWRLEELLGSGAMGAVYRASQRDGTQAAVKVLLHGADAGLRKRFLREERSLKSLDHPNVVGLLGSDTEGEQPWIALEFVKGQDLYSLLKRDKRLALDRVRPIMLGVLRGLKAAHTAGIVHRDLKPGNVLLSSGGRVKVADFGLARRDAESLALTRAGDVMGTPFYMSPEQVAGTEIKPSSDVYSVGAMMFHLLAGRPVFTGSLTDVLEAHATAPPPDLGELVPELPRRVVELVSACLWKDPDDRPSVDQLIAGLSALGKKPPASGRPQRPQAAAAAKAPPPSASPTPAAKAERKSQRTRRRGAASNPYLPVLDQVEVAPPLSLPGPQPSPSLPRSRPLDLLAALITAVVVLRCLGVGGKALAEVEWLAPARAVLTPPGLFVGIAIAAALAIDRLFSISDRARLRMRAKRLARQGLVAQAARALELLGDRRAGARLLQEHGRHSEAATMLLAAGEPTLAGEMIERGGDPRKALDVYRAAGDMEQAFRVALAGKSTHAAAYLLRYGQVEDAAEVHLRGGRPFEAADVLERGDRREEALHLLEEEFHGGEPREYWTHLGKEGSIEDARRSLALRIAWLHEDLGFPAKAAGYVEEAGDDLRAASLYGAAGWREEETRCFLAGVERENVTLNGEQRERAARLIKELKKQRDPRVARLLELTGATLEAAKAYRASGKARRKNKGDLRRAARLFSKAGDPKAGAACAEEGGDRKLAAELYAAAGDHQRAASMFEALGAFEKAAKAYGALGKRADQARMFGKAGEPLSAAKTLVDLGQLGAAVELLNGIPAESHEHYDAQSLRADILLLEGKNEQALELYDEILGQDITFAEELPAHLRRVEALENLGRNDAAVSALELLQEKSFAPGDLNERLALARSRKSKPQGEQPRKVRGAHDLIGQELDRYEVTRIIAEGSFAWVYEGRHTALDRSVALKVLKPSLLSGDVAERFLREGRALAALEDPNLIRIYDAGQDHGIPYLVLELIDGPSLRHFLEELEDQLSVARAARLGAGILGGLQCAHAAGIVHRDLKPANVLVAPGEVSKVLDFGIARLVDDGTRAKTEHFMGTPRYTSPEQARGDEVAAAADQYSAALIIYELLTGRLPFDSTTSLGWLSKHKEAKPAPVRKFRPDCPQELGDALMRALSKAPGERFPDVEAMRRVVLGYAES